MNARRDQHSPPRSAESAQSSAGIERHVSITDGRLDSQDLFAGTREVTILHGSDAYRLRITAQKQAHFDEMKRGRWITPR
jgi:hemin uptake protein HemP